MNASDRTLLQPQKFPFSPPMGLSSSSGETEWQTSKKSLLERNSTLYNNTFMSDVRFLVGEDMIVPAHKYVLSIGSPVFYTMFYGELAKTQSPECDTIKVPDIEPSAFMAMMKYLYYDAVQLNMDNVVSTLYASKKYILPHLTGHCISFLSRNMTSDNVCYLLSMTHIVDDDDFTKKCWNLIELNPRTVLSSESFVKIDHPTLIDIISRNTLKCSEMDIFKASLEWANARLDEDKDNHSGDEKEEDDLGPKRRELLGPVLQLIRFPLMTNIEFADEVVPSGVLNLKEVTDIFMYISSTKTKPKVDFITTPRKGCNNGYRRSKYYKD